MGNIQGLLKKTKISHENGANTDLKVPEQLEETLNCDIRNKLYVKEVYSKKQVEFQSLDANLDFENELYLPTSPKPQAPIF